MGIVFFFGGGDEAHVAGDRIFFVVYLNHKLQIIMYAFGRLIT